jgi:hypothetical protein
VEETLYRARGYQPPVDDLPWQDDYFSGQASAMPRVGPGRTAGDTPPARAASIFRRYETR